MTATYAILAAAGGSTRMQLGAAEPSKVLLPLGPFGSVLAYSARTIKHSGVVDGIAVVGRAADLPLLIAECERAAPGLEVVGVAGGTTRQESVANALGRLTGHAELVLIHDAARPLCSPNLVRAVRHAAHEEGAAIPCVPVKSTLKRSSSGIAIECTVARAELWEAQTPQAFRFDIIYSAHQRARREGWVATDDSELVERSGLTVALVPGEERNLKVTTPADLELAKLIISGTTLEA